MSDAGLGIAVSLSDNEVKEAKKLINKLNRLKASDLTVQDMFDIKEAQTHTYYHPPYCLSELRRLVNRLCKK